MKNKLIKANSEGKMKNNMKESNITQKWVNVLFPFSQGYSMKITASEISKKTKIPQQSVSRTLNNLVLNNLINYKEEGRNKLFYFNLQEQNTLLIFQIIEIQKMLEFNLKNKKVYVILKELLNYCETIIIFGSYSSKKHNEDSDLDLIIFNVKNKEDFNKKIKEFTIEINSHFTNYKDFKKLVSEKNSLALEVLENHLVIGDTLKVVEIFSNE